MELERIQKINNLALELMKQGLVSDREEALKQAEQLLSRQGCSSLKETLKNTSESSFGDLSLADQTPFLPEKNNQKEKILSPEEITTLLEKNTQFIVKKISSYQKELKQMKEEIEKLKKNFWELAEKIKNKNFLLEDESGTKESLKKEDKEKTGKNKEGPLHPRSGDYREEDVSIEKFFYSGSKTSD